MPPSRLPQGDSGDDASRSRTEWRTGAGGDVVGDARVGPRGPAAPSPSPHRQGTATTRIYLLCFFSLHLIDDWAVCRVFNKDLAAAKNTPHQMAPSVDGAMDEPLAFLDVDGFANYDELLNNAVLLDNSDLSMLMDSRSGADDFTARASSSTSSDALPLEPDTEHRTIKAEPPMPQQQMQSPNYFFMPAATANGNHGGAGYSPYQEAMWDQQTAIRRHCKPEAASSSAARRFFVTGALAGAADTSFPMPSSLSYVDLEELCQGEPLMDYSNMW
ncbi:hypothetical protein ZWY2020_034609 [Hordeum vulgare]|nr:hypothetical protein ZWY2020_034609 [Hordeum vulgare]